MQDRKKWQIRFIFLNFEFETKFPRKNQKIVLPAMKKQIHRDFFRHTPFRVRIFFLLFLWMPAGVCLSETTGSHGILKRPSIRRFEKDADLSQTIVLFSYQDSLGFLWFGTFDGLYRYDGYETRKFKYNHLNPNSISNNVVTSMVEDHYGYYWISTHEGLNRFDPRSEKFVHYFHHNNDTASLICDFINVLFLDRNGYLWIGTSEGLSILDTRSGTIVANYGNLNNIERNYVANIQSFDGTNIWINTSEGSIITRISGKHYHQLKFVSPGYQKQGQRFSGDFFRLIRDPTGIFWLLSNDTLRVFNERSGELKIFSLPGNIMPARPDYIFRDKDGKIWIGLQHGGILKIDPEKVILSARPLKIKPVLRSGSDFIYYQYDPAAFINPAYHLKYRHFFTDRSGILWIGSEQGLFNLDLRQNPFKWYADFRIKNLPISNEVTSLGMNQYNQLLFGTTNTFAGILLGKGEKIQLLLKNNAVNTMVTSIYEDLYGDYWIGIMGLGMTRLDNQGRIIARYTPEENGNKHLPFWTVWCLLEDSRQNLWVGTLEGLVKLRLSSTTGRKREVISEKVYTHTPGNPHSLSDNNIWSLFEDSHGRIWIGTNAGGLNLYQPATDDFIRFEMNRADPDALQNQAVNVIYEDHNGTLWLGTEYGLAAVKYNRGKAVFRHFTENEGLCNNGITGIEEDHAGNLWISTKSGLSRFTPPDDPFNKKDKWTFVNYYASDGLQGNKFNPFAYAQDAGGMIYFGGDNGITAFHPDSLHGNHVLPAVNLTHFKIRNEEVIPGDTLNHKYIFRNSITYTEQVILTYKQNDLTFGFAGDYSANPGNIIYSYMLEGFEHNWNTVTAEHHFAIYTNIPPGEYTFRVKASLSGNSAYGPEKKLHIIIYPPFWNTWWFRFLIILFVAGLIVAYFRYKTFALRKQKQVLAELVGIRTREIEKARERLEEQNRQIIKQKDQIELQNRNLKQLTEIGQKITSSIRVRDIINQVYDSINQLMDAQIFYIGLVNNKNKNITFWGRLYKGTPLHTEVIPLKDDNRLSVWCVRNNRIAFLNDVEKDARKYLGKHFMGYAGEKKPKSAIYIPLVSGENKITGILVVKSFKKNIYTNTHLDMLKNMASHIAIALENAKAYNRVKEASDKLKQMDRIKTRFFTNISHEFRTPLTLILSPIRNMISRFGQNGLKEYVNELKLVERNAGRLLRLINQLLEVSRIEGENIKLSVAKGDLVEALRRIAEPFYVHANFKDIQLMFESPEKKHICYFDFDKVEKIVYNLLSNAIKYTNERGIVVLSVDFSVTNDNTTAEIKVKDTGIGIPRKNLKTIFNRFSQVGDGGDSHNPGTGIGLYLTKKLVETHKGTIQVSSTPGSGTEFAVHLPVSKEHFSPDEMNRDELMQTVITGESPIPHDFENNIRLLQHHIDKQKKTLLIVEDNPDVSFYLAGHFKKEYNILIALDGEDGYNQARKRNPDMIISDIMMPKMDGITLCKKLKTDSLTSHIPVILLTARADGETQKSGYETGADDYVIKPFNIDLLAQRIKNLIGLREKLKDRFMTVSLTDLKGNVPTSTDEKLLRRIMESIERNLSNPDFSIDMLTREAGISRAQLFRKIGALTKNRSVSDFIISYRLRAAAELFSQGYHNVSEVAYNVGFKNASHFTTRFKKQYGKTPVDFIKSIK